VAQGSEAKAAQKVQGFAAVPFAPTSGVYAVPSVQDKARLRERFGNAAEAS